MNTNIYIHALNKLPILGPKRLLQIIEHFDDISETLGAGASGFIAAGLDPDIAAKIADHLKMTAIEKEIELLDKEQIKLVSIGEPLYPALLLEIPQPPPLLYYKGILKDADETMIAIVGTRNITTYGRSIVPEITAGLAKQNITIVSGLAFGVDALAHQTCVNEKRRTIAIVGSGIDSGSIYPKHHQFLAEQILETGGVIISEYPPQTPAYKQHFIARNRIISGVSAGTLVVEANLKSGALITARHALDQNRPVYAIPGPIYNPGSEGPHNLIRMGAQLVTKTEHILEDLLIETSETNTELDYTDLTPEQLQTYSQLSREPKGINEIIRTSKLDAGTVTAALVFLEMKGVIQNIGGQQYIITHRTTK